MSLDLHAGVGVGEDFVVFECPCAVVPDIHAALLSTVNAVAAQAWIGAVVYRDARKALTADITFLEIESALRDIHAEPLTAAILSKCQIDDSAHVRLKEDRILPGGFDHDVASVAVADDFDGLVDDDALSVEAGPNQDSSP